MGMLYGENDTGLKVEPVPIQDDIEEDTQQDTLQHQETQAPSKKRTKVVKQKGKSKKKRGSTSKALPTDGVESDDEEEGTKRGPNWKEHWIVNLVHLRGTMHEKFSGMKKQGVDNWGVLHTHLVAACPDFDCSSDACRKKWKKIYDEYKADYFANSIFGNNRSTKCRWYSLIDGYMHDRANVYKHVHGSAQDEDPNVMLEEGQEIAGDNSQRTQPTATTSQTPTGKKSEKIATQEAIAQMPEQSKRIVDVVKEAELAKLGLLQGMLATMNELVKKL